MGGGEGATCPILVVSQMTQAKAASRAVHQWLVGARVTGVTRPCQGNPDQHPGPASATELGGCRVAEDDGLSSVRFAKFAEREPCRLDHHSPRPVAHGRATLGLTRRRDRETESVRVPDSERPRVPHIGGFRLERAPARSDPRRDSVDALGCRELE